MSRGPNRPLLGRISDLWIRIRPWTPWVSLSLGIWSAFGVVRRYDQARRVAWLLAGIWLAFGAMVWLRRFVRHREVAPKWVSGMSFALAWIAQSMSQEILFFVLPFWIRSTTWTSVNAPFTVLLIVLAGATVFDPVYQGKIAPRTHWRLVHKALVAFAGLAFVVPALLGAHTIAALAIAGGLAGMATTFAIPTQRKVNLALLGAFVGASMAVIFCGWIAPVPLRVEKGVITSGVRDRLPVDSLSRSPIGRELWAWTPVFAPSGLNDTLVHAWSRDGRELARVPLVLHGGRKEGFRTWSSSRGVASQAGKVRVDVSTSGGQLVGRMTVSVGPL